MSTPNNEIARLCRITPPDVAVELNVLPVHVEHLGSIENVAKAKAELVEGMKPNGTAILNADDFRVAAMRDLHKGEDNNFRNRKRSGCFGKRNRNGKIWRNRFCFESAERKRARSNLRFRENITF